MADRRQRFKNEKHEYHDPSLLLGCWFDERARRETDFQEHVHLFCKNELPVQKCNTFFNVLNRKVEYTESFDGFLRNGSTLGLAWGCSQALLSALPTAVTAEGYHKPPCLATGATPPSPDVLPARSAIKIFRSDARIPDSVPLMHRECLLFNLVEPSKRLFLYWESGDPMPIENPKWMACSGSHALWKTTDSDTYIVANRSVVVCHVASGYQLTLEKNSPIRTLLGKEWGISCRFDPKVSDTWRFVVSYQDPIRMCRPPVVNCNVWKIWKH